MLKALLRDALVYGASTMLTRAVSLVLVPVYTRLLEPTEYGAIDILSIFGSLATLTVALEVGQAVARFLPDSDSHDARRRLVSTASLFALCVYSAFLLVGLLAVDPLRRAIVGADAMNDTVALALCSIWAIGLFQLAQNVLRFSIKPIAFTASNLLFSGGSLVVGVILVVGLDAGVAGVFAGQVVGGLVGLVAAVWFARDLYRPMFSAAELKAMLAFSIPLVPASLGVFVTLYVDRIALNALESLSSVGLFGIGYRLASLITLLLIGIQMALTPLIYQRYQEPSTPSELARIFRMFVAFALFVCLCLSIWAPEILRLATAPAYYAAHAVVPLLTPAVLLANMYVFMPGLAIAKRTRTIGIITISGAVLNTALNLILIPLMSIQGAALATLISAAVVFLAYVRASQSTYVVPHRWRPLGLAVAGYAALVVLGLSADHGSALGAGTKLLVMMSWLAIVVGTRLLSISEIRWGIARLRRMKPAAP